MTTQAESFVRAYLGQKLPAGFDIAVSPGVEVTTRADGSVWLRNRTWRDGTFSATESAPAECLRWPPRARWGPAE